MYNQKWLKIITIGVWIVFYIAAFYLCMQIQYSDGDDVFFKETTAANALFPYIKWRYITWQGRLTSEAMTWFGFRMGLQAWRFVNAFVITMLPLGLLKIVRAMFPERITEYRVLLFSILSCVSILCMDVQVIGYGAFWVTGSLFYLWSFVAGIWALIPVAMQVFQEEVDWKHYLYAIPLAFITSMGMEQSAAVCVVFGILAIIYTAARFRYLPKLLTLQTVIVIAGMVIVFLSPGTVERTASETATWLPEFATMGVSQHIFITVQWLMQALAQESRAYMIAIWLLLICLLAGREREGKYHLTKQFSSVSFRKAEEKKNTRFLSVLALVFTGAGALSYAGITFFSEMGTGVVDAAVPVTKAANWQTVTMQNYIAIIWWCVAVVVTLVLLWQAGENLLLKITQELIFLGGLACSAIMYFSPTIYASGERVFFMMEIMFWLLLLVLLAQLYQKNTFKAGVVLLVVVAVVQTGSRYLMELGILQNQ